MQDKGWNWGRSFELRAGQPLLSMRLLCLRWFGGFIVWIPSKRRKSFGAKKAFQSIVCRELQLRVEDSANPVSFGILGIVRELGSRRLGDLVFDGVCRTHPTSVDLEFSLSPIEAPQQAFKLVEPLGQIVQDVIKIASKINEPVSARRSLSCVSACGRYHAPAKWRKVVRHGKAIQHEIVRITKILPILLMVRVVFVDASDQWRLIAHRLRFFGITFRLCRRTPRRGAGAG